MPNIKKNELTMTKLLRPSDAEVLRKVELMKQKKTNHGQPISSVMARHVQETNQELEENTSMNI